MAIPTPLEVTGTMRERAYKITIDNRLGQDPVIYFDQEVAVELGVETLLKPSTSINEKFNPETANTSFPLLNPIDGTELGTSMTYTEFHIAVYSIYVAVKAKRLAEAEQERLDIIAREEAAEAKRLADEALVAADQAAIAAFKQQHGIV